MYLCVFYIYIGRSRYVWASITRCDLSVRRQMLENVVLDGYCRGCQLIRQLPDKGYDDADESVNRERELSAARRQFDELNVSHTGTLCEEEVVAMVTQLRPARTPRQDIEATAEEVIEQFATQMGRCGHDKVPGAALEFEDFLAAWEWLGGDAMERQLTDRGKALRDQREQERWDGATENHTTTA